jgi:N-acetylmuramoyl-L-alanine amidase
MKEQIRKIIIVALIAVIVVIFDYTYIHVFVNHRNTFGNRVVIIDAGHGGIDGGAIGKNGTIEKDINLDISKKVKAYIESGGDTCIMIREVDEGLYSEYGTIRNKKNEDLKNRKDIIKKYKADIFISIHLNSFPESQYYGAQVFYPKDNEDSKRLAKFVQDELLKMLDMGNKRVEKSSDSYYLLRDNPVPSVLIECGFLSNPEEERLLGQEEYRNKISWAIYRGLARFFTEPKS